MAQNKSVTQFSMNDFYSVAVSRVDGWNALMDLANKLARAQAGAKSTEGLADGCAELLGELEIKDRCWAFPGIELQSHAEKTLRSKDYSGFSKIVTHICNTLMNGHYRRSIHAWDVNEESSEDIGQAPEYYEQRDHTRPYFEVLCVNAPLVADGHQKHGREDLARLRRPEDHFVYEPVFVESFEDAVAAMIVNHDFQSMIIYDNFPFASQFDMGPLHKLLEPHIDHDPDDLDYDTYGTVLAKTIRAIRPEIDVFLVSGRGVEALAGDVHAENVKRIFYDLEEINEIHLCVLQGVADRYETPHFTNLQKFSRRPIGTFHALPIARMKSITKSHWIKDMGTFYGANLFMAETSTTAGGLDSLLEPTGTIKAACEHAARAFGSDLTYFVTNGTSTANKIVVQALCKPGDIVLVDRNCHKSHHYGFVLTGAQPYYLEAYPMLEYSMYGGVPLATIKDALLKLKSEGNLHKARMVLLTNCTFDGHIYNVQRVMEECLAIKPDLVFLWDEAWYAFGTFSPLHRGRTAMGAVKALRERYASDAYRAEYEAYKEKVGDIDLNNPNMQTMRLLPDPDKVRLRAYCTQSTHKSLSALRQGSMVHVNDEDYHSEVHELFEEAYFTHTSTSPNAQIIASLDLARRQAELEGYALVREQIQLAIEMRKLVNENPFLSKYFHIATPSEMVPGKYRQSGIENYTDDELCWTEVVKMWEEDEFVLDPTRLTLICGTAGYDGTEFKDYLMDKKDIQLNKTARNSILLQSNINNTRSATAHVIQALTEIAKRLDKEVGNENTSAGKAFQKRVHSLMHELPDLPNFSRFHDFYRDNPESLTSQGHMRVGYFQAYEADKCEHIHVESEELERRLKEGPELVSACFVIPYPPGFPIMVPGQVITHEIVQFMRELDVKEIHGYNADAGLRCIKPEALET